MEFTSEELTLAARVARARGFNNMAQDIEEQVEKATLNTDEVELYKQIHEHLFDTSEYNTFHNRTMDLIKLVYAAGWSKSKASAYISSYATWDYFHDVPRNTLVKDADGDYWWDYKGESYFAPRDVKVEKIVEEYSQYKHLSGCSDPDYYGPFTFVQEIPISA